MSVSFMGLWRGWGVFFWLGDLPFDIVNLYFSPGTKKEHGQCFYQSTLSKITDIQPLRAGKEKA